MAASHTEAAMNIRYRVELSEAERQALITLLGGGWHAARKIKRAQVLLAADTGQGDDAIAASLAVSVATVRRTKRRFVEGNLERALRTLELLAGEMLRLTEHHSLSRETVRRRLAENALKPWREEMWCVPHIDGEYVARMEDVLDLYAEAPDPGSPVVCLDESPLQLIGEAREAIPAAPGRVARYDYEYRRCGTVNLFVA